jgi:hypothetical protein
LILAHEDTTCVTGDKTALAAKFGPRPAAAGETTGLLYVLQSRRQQVEVV